MARSRKLLTVGAVSVAALALAASTSVTGAYFTDSHPGSINSSTGAVVVTPTSTLALDFTKSLPGVFKTNRVTFTAAGTAGEDIWLVFDDVASNDVDFLRGTPQQGPAPLGGYGHFALVSDAGSFTSYNLATGASPCPVNWKGHGGSDAQATSATPVAYCPVPKAILLSENLTYGTKGYADVTFGFTKLLKSKVAQNSQAGDIAPYKIVATQHGILPTDPENEIG